MSQSLNSTKTITIRPWESTGLRHDSGTSTSLRNTTSPTNVSRGTRGGIGIITQPNTSKTQTESRIKPMLDVSSEDTKIISVVSSIDKGSSQLSSTTASSPNGFRSTRPMKTTSKNYLKCVSCGNLGQWRAVTKNSVCTDCRIFNPEHRLLTRTKVLEIYGKCAPTIGVSTTGSTSNSNNNKTIQIAGTLGLTKDDLYHAYMKQQIRMYTVPNEFHDSKYPMRLYHQVDIEDLYRRKFPGIPVPKIPDSKQW